jgi:hypothetical protein
MANFCTQCGSPLTGPFCVKCGAGARQSATSAPPQPVLQPTTVPSTQGTVPAMASTPRPSVDTPSPGVNKKMSPLVKLGIAAIVIIFVGGALAAGGVYYIAHRVSQKIHQAADGLIGSGSDSNSGNSDSAHSGSAGSTRGSMGDVCRLLSKEDVSRAIGVEIVHTQPADNGCSYIAKGTQADMTAKHVTAMMAARGADKKTQQIIQNFAGGMGQMFASEKPASEQDTSGEVPVFSFSVDQNAADEQMRLNAKGLAVLGEQQGLPGIGDQAFVSADGMIFMRKGKNLVRIIFITCPCGTEAVKPLAKEIADAL